MHVPQRTGRPCLLLVACLATPALAEPPPAAAGSATPGSTRIDTERRGQQGETLLHWVVFEGDIGMVRQLIAAGADVNARVEKGATPLHMAAYRGHTEIARLLLDHGARINAETDAGVTALDWAQRNRHADLIQLLRGRGGKQGQAAAAEREKPVTADVRRPLRLDPLHLSLEYQAGDKRFDPATQPADSELRLVTDKGGSRVQLGAYSSEPRAREAWATYRKQHPELLTGHELLLDSATVRDKRYFRVQIGGLSKTAAKALCSRLEAREQPCRVISRK